MKARELVGKNIQRLRRDRGWTQEDLAAHAEIDRRHVGRIESGQANVTIDVLERLMTALRSDLRQLLEPAGNADPATAARVARQPLKKGPRTKR